MFTFSDAFDFILLEEVATSAEAACLQKILKNEIVYPLRKYVLKIGILLHSYLYVHGIIKLSS